jgi:hypothetical protein
METATLREFYETAKAVSPVPVEEVTIKDGSKGYYNHVTVSIGSKKAWPLCRSVKHLFMRWPMRCFT